MAWGRRKSNLKLVENQPSLLIFPATDLFSAFSPHRGFQPPPSSSPVFSPSSPPPVAIKSSHVVVAPLLSLSLSSVKIFFSATVTSLNSSNSRSSGQHLAQKPFSFPKTARVAALSPATPTTPTASFPSPSQASVFFLFQRWPEPATGLTTAATPCTTGQDPSSLNAR